MFHNVTFTLSHMDTSSDEYIQFASRATEEVSQLSLHMINEMYILLNWKENCLVGLNLLETRQNLSLFK